MTHTEQCIQTLADAFGKGICPRALYIASLESLVRLAIAESISRPILATQADLQRVAEIREVSRKAS